MNPILAELLHGAGLSHMCNLDGGFTKSSGFIRRLMWENKHKHNGKYQNPTFPLHSNSTMNAPAKFDYEKIANAEQSGKNESAYGASPFIQRHFGSVRAVSKEKPKESVEQQEARKTFVAEENKPEVKERIEEKPKEEKKAEKHSAPSEDSKAKESARKKSAYELKKEAKRMAEEAEERRRNPEPEISDALKEELRDFAEKHPGRSPFQLGGIFSRDITKAMTKREGLETPKDTPYRQSGEYKLSELIKKWYAYQQKYNHLIKPVPKGSIPVDESQASKQNFTERQLHWMKYYGKDLMKTYDTVGEYAIPEGSSHIPSVVDAVLWANNEVEKGENPKLTRDQVIYYLQKKIGLK